MALIGLVRVSTAKQETQRQHDALKAAECERVFEEKRSGKLEIEARPGLLAAIDYMRTGDMLTVQEIDRLGRNTLAGLLTLAGLFERGIAVKVLEGIAAGEHTKNSVVLTLALAIAEERREEIVRKTKDGLNAAARLGRRGGRPSVVDPDKRRAILARHAENQSLREIARGVGVAKTTVDRVIKAAEIGLDIAAPAASGTG